MKLSIGVLILLIISFIFPPPIVLASAPSGSCSGGTCNFHFLHQSSGSLIMSAGLRIGLQGLGYSTAETNMQTCGGLGTDYDGPDCLADYWFNGNLGSAASADIVMFKSCFHLVMLGPTATDLERWKSKYLNRFIYGTGGSGCSGASCNGYAKNNPNQLIIAMPAIPFNLTTYGGKSTLTSSDIIEAWGEWLKKDFVNIARSKGIYNLASFDIFDYFADGKSDGAENNGNNLQCSEFNQDGDSHLDGFANGCAAGNNGAPSMRDFIDTVANDFFPDKNANLYAPLSYRCTGSCPAVIGGSPGLTPTPVVSCPSGNLGNLNCDSLGLINESDLNILLNKWSPQGPVPTASSGQWSADLYNDGKVNEQDLNFIFTHWKTN